jgi:hypothetical protein
MEFEFLEADFISKINLVLDTVAENINPDLLT